MINYELKNRKWLVRATKDNIVKEFSELRTEFNIKQFGDHKLNELELSLTNLNTEDRKFFDASKYAINIELFAGYEKNFGLIFTGQTDIINIKKGVGVKGFNLTENKRDDADWITTITAYDGVKTTKNNVFTIARRGKVSVEGVIQEAINHLGLPKGSIKLKGLKKEYWNNGISATGAGWTFLVNLCRSNGFTIDIKNGVVNIRKISEPFGNDIILLSPSSGLILSPEKTEKGIKAQCLLRHEIHTGSLIQIESENINGLFLITNVTHEGDSDGDKWYTNIEAQYYDK